MKAHPVPALPWGTKEYNQTPEARAFASQVTRGTTTPSTAITVIWLGAHLALVKRAGSRGWASRGHSRYYPTIYEALDRHAAGGNHFALDVFSGTDLLPFEFAPTKVRPKDVQAYRFGASVPAARAGAGKTAVQVFLTAWVERLSGLDARYAARHAAFAVKAAQDEAAKRAAQEAEQARAARAVKLARAAPQMVEALRTGVWDLATILGERSGLKAAAILAGERPAGPVGGVWITLALMIDALKAAGESLPGEVRS